MNAARTKEACSLSWIMLRCSMEMEQTFLASSPRGAGRSKEYVFDERDAESILSRGDAAHSAQQAPVVLFSLLFVVTMRKLPLGPCSTCRLLAEPCTEGEWT